MDTVKRFVQSPEFARLMLDSIAEGILTIDGEGIVQSFNAGAARLFGYTADEVIGRHCEMLVPATFVDMLNGKLALIYEAGNPGKVEFNERMMGQRKDGSLFSYELIVSLADLDDQALHICIIRDVSESRLLKEELARIKLGIDQLLDGVYMFDRATTKLFYANLSASRQLGYSDGELLTKIVGDLAKNLEYENLNTELDKFRTGENNKYTFNAELTQTDGQLISVEATLQSVKTDGGYEQIIAVIRDITEQKALHREKNEQRQYLRAIVDNTVDGIVTIDELGIVESFNKAACLMFGYTPEEVIGQNVKLLMPESVAAQHDGYLRRYRETGEKRIIGIGREVEGQRKDGSIFPLELAIAEVKLAERRVFSGVLRDITQRRAMEDELLSAKADADSANLAKSEFLARMSHELRTPLNSILGFTQLLELEELSEDALVNVDHILKAGRHLTDLISEVLDIARIESGRQQLSLEPVHVGEILRGSWSMIVPLANSRNISMETPDYESSCNFFVLADLQRLKQVLLNLMSNAIKYNYDSGTIQIDCSEVRDGMLQISVTDTGPGIKEENQDFIFEAFSRIADGDKVVEGTGIGLALTKAMVEGMGGQLGLESEWGAGSRFWVELPLIDEPESWQKKVPDEGQLIQAGTMSVPGKHSSVLYIEDNVANTRLMEMVFALFPDIELTICVQGSIGLDLAVNKAPDLILLDLNLPDLPGQEVLARLKANPLTQHIPVIVISADATQGEIERSLNAGAHEYVTKPFNIRELIQTLKEFFSG